MYVCLPTTLPCHSTLYLGIETYHCVPLMCTITLWTPNLKTVLKVEHPVNGSYRSISCPEGGSQDWRQWQSLLVLSYSNPFHSDIPILKTELRFDGVKYLRWGHRANSVGYNLVAHTCDLRTWEAEAGQSEVQDLPGAGAQVEPLPGICESLGSIPGLPPPPTKEIQGYI